MGTLFLSEPTNNHWRCTQGTDPDTDLVRERFLASPHKLATEETISSNKDVRPIWQEWLPSKRLAVPGSLIQAFVQEVQKQLHHVNEKDGESLEQTMLKTLTYPDGLDFCRSCITYSSFKKPHTTSIAPIKARKLLILFMLD